MKRFGRQQKRNLKIELQSSCLLRQREQAELKHKIRKLENELTFLKSDMFFREDPGQNHVMSMRIAEKIPHASTFNLFVDTKTVELIVDPCPIFVKYCMTEAEMIRHVENPYPLAEQLINHIRPNLATRITTIFRRSLGLEDKQNLKGG